MRKICLLLSFILIWCPSVYAAEIYYSTDFKNESINLNGVVDEAKGNRLVGVKILDENEDVVFIQTIASDDKGNIDEILKMPQDMKSGEYKLSVSAVGLSDPLVFPFEYADSADAEKLLKDLNAADNAKTLTETLNSNISKFNLPGGFYDKLSEGTKEKIGEEIFVGRPTGGYESLNDIVKILKRETAIFSIGASSTVDDIEKVLSAFKDIFNITDKNTNIHLYKIYSGLSTSQKSIFDEVLLQTNPRNLTEFYTDFDKAVFLAVISSADEPQKITDAISQNGKTVGLDFTCYNKCKPSTVALALLGNKYLTMNELESAIKKIYTNEDNNTTNSGGNGGSGSSGGTGGKGGSITAPSISNNADNKLPSEQRFSDLAGVEWAKDAIEYLADKDIVSGDGDGTFRPNDFITREEFVKMLVEAFGLYNSDAKSDFDDLGQNHWAYLYVSSAYESKIVKGISETEFGIGENITRQDMAVMSANAVKSLGIEMSGDEKTFSDAGSISDYAIDAVQSMAKVGIINGFEDGSFAPFAMATRAQAAKILYGLLLFKGA